MSRALHLYEILKREQEVCTHDIWREMNTAPMRAFNEAKKMNLPVENSYMPDGKRKMCRHGDKNYAVYRIRTEPEQLTMTQRIYEPYHQ